MQDLIITAAFLVAVILLYRFRDPIFGALARFDARNRARRREEIQDRHDPLAHYKHTARVASEQVEEIGILETSDERTGLSVTRYLFEGEQFATREEAEAARRESILQKARGFYQELPAALQARRSDKLH